MSQLTQKVLLLSKTRWAMEDEKTGEVRTGTTVRYIEGLDALERKDNFVGVRVAKVTFDRGLYDELFEVPGYYRIGFDISIVGDKSTLKPVSIEFDSSLKPAAAPAAAK